MQCASLDFVHEGQGPGHGLDCLIDRPLAAIRPLVGSLKDQFDSIGRWVKSEISSRDLVWGACHGDAWANLGSMMEMELSSTSSTVAQAGWPTT